MIALADRLVVRPARPEDSAARCELFARVAMEADLGLSVRRDPDFDALYRLQAQDWLSVVVDHGGTIEGTGTIVVRDGYVGGVVRRVGYLGDLRFSRAVEGRFLLDRHYAALLEEARDRFGCELFLTSVIASNTRALRALTRRTRRSEAAGRPVYAPIGTFAIRSLHLLLPRWRSRSPFAVRVATDADIPAIAGLLDTDGRRRPFGYVMHPEELRRRLREWPGLGIESFLVAEDRRGDLVGCLALWDASPVKRMLVTAYRNGMRRVRMGHDIVAAVLGRAHLPRLGEAFRYQYVTHQAVRGDDPRILRALLERAYRDARVTGYHFISVCAPADSPLAMAFDGLVRTDLDARLFVVALPGVDMAAVLAQREWPGFEMALV